MIKATRKGVRKLVTHRQRSGNHSGYPLLQKDRSLLFCRTAIEKYQLQLTGLLPYIGSQPLRKGDARPKFILIELQLAGTCMPRKMKNAYVVAPARKNALNIRLPYLPERQGIALTDQLLKQAVDDLHLLAHRFQRVVLCVGKCQHYNPRGHAKDF